MLSQEQVEDFSRGGFHVAEDAVDARRLDAIQAVLAGRVEESRTHDAPSGEPAVDGRACTELIDGREHGNA